MIARQSPAWAQVQIPKITIGKRPTVGTDTLRPKDSAAAPVTDDPAAVSLVRSSASPVRIAGSFEVRVEDLGRHAVA